MSMDDIVAYLQSGSLDRDTPDLDLYPHLTAAVKSQPVHDDDLPSKDVVMPSDDELVDLPKLAPGEPMNFKASSAYDLPPKGDVVHTYENGDVLHENGAIVSPEFPFNPVVDELVTLNPSDEEINQAVVKSGKRGRKEQYDVSALAVGEYLLYTGNGGLPSARVMASIKGKKLGCKFQAKQVGDEIHISRKS